MKLGIGDWGLGVGGLGCWGGAPTPNHTTPPHKKKKKKILL